MTRVFHSPACCLLLGSLVWGWRRRSRAETFISGPDSKTFQTLVLLNERTCSMNYTCAQLCVNSGTRYLLCKLPSWQTAWTQYSIAVPLSCTENSYNQERFLSRYYFNEETTKTSRSGTKGLVQQEVNCN